MRTTQKLIERLTAQIEYALPSGPPVFDKKFILGGTEGDIEVARMCLEKWAQEGKCRILKPIELAHDNDNVVTMLTYISKALPATRKYSVEEFERILIGRIKQFNSPSVLNRSFILKGLEQCLDNATVVLSKWAQEGKCQIIKPLKEAQSDDDVVKLEPQFTLSLG